MGESVGDGVPKIVEAEAGYGRARVGVKSHVPGLGPGVEEGRQKGEPDGARLEGEGERWENIPSHGGRRKNKLQHRGRIKRETAEVRDLPTLESINCVCFF